MSDIAAYAYIFFGAFVSIGLIGGFCRLSINFLTRL